ncbi:UNVERIFIED_CONTAM: hypothetical protein PYX00_011063 [Menopon gallinae]|uniref:UDP-N-acetylglucosamine 1-carboxyvinyltransferase n=1 Tax=Menopon gallinae TaxID=328185 RepID=A0AAW2H6Z3_9NEOP
MDGTPACGDSERVLSFKAHRGEHKEVRVGDEVVVESDSYMVWWQALVALILPFCIALYLFFGLHYPWFILALPFLVAWAILVLARQDLGAKVEKLESNTYAIEAKHLRCCEISTKKAQAIRASILFVGPLLARMGHVILPPPGGDVIGRRRLDTHFLAMQQLGAEVKTNGVFDIRCNKLVAKDIFLDEASVTGTENAIMAAVMAEGVTILNNAACEPHVQDLCNMLVSMGARIEGIGSNRLIISGVEVLGGTDFTIGSDFMEVGSLIALAVVTGSEIEIEEAQPENLRMVQIGFAKLGVHWQVKGRNILVPKEQKLQVYHDMGGVLAKIDDAPWPGFPPDLMSIMIVVATQAQGTILIHEKMFESRMYFVDKLINMGAHIILCDPHRAVISGKTSLQAACLSSPDVRAGMAMLIASLCAKGTSEIANIYQIERGYENIWERLNALGANIQRVSS